jgi:glycosyltransferase involved in cell wall biosynthesis
MHVLQVSFFVDAARRPPAQLLAAWHALPEIAAAAHGAGVRVTVIQASLVEDTLTQEGITFHFVAPAGDGPLTRAPRFAQLVHALEPDVFHVHGLNFAREVVGLRRLAPCTPILLQDHADRPPRFWRRGRFRLGLDQADAFSFCTREQAAPFVRAGVLGAHAVLFEIPESTSRFTPGPRAAARKATAMYGDPALLWVGHLDTNKDPLCVLEGVALAARELPGLQLWCSFGSAPLLESVQARLAADQDLRSRVHLLGQLPHARIQDFMRAADLFVLGSHREGCNFSVLEALASGLWPVVTDIPSMRALTGQGVVGDLWQRGDPQSLAAALQRAAAGTNDARRAAVRAHFETRLSRAALGQKLAAAYAQLLKPAQPLRRVELPR